MSVNPEDCENSQFRRWKSGNLNFIGFLENSTQNLTLNRKYPYKHTTWIPPWNDVDRFHVVSTWNPRGVFAGISLHYFVRHYSVMASQMGGQTLRNKKCQRHYSFQSIKYYIVGIVYLMLTEYFRSLASHSMEVSQWSEVYGRVMDEIQYINHTPQILFCRFQIFCLR